MNLGNRATAALRHYGWTVQADFERLAKEAA